MIPWGLIWTAGGRLPLWSVVCLLCWAAGAWMGYQWAEDQRAESVQRAIEQAAQVAQQDQELINADAQTRYEIRVQYQTIARNVPGVAVADCRDLGPDYVRLFNDAIRSANPANTPR